MTPLRSTADHPVFDHRPKVMFHSERPAMARVVDVRQPCLVQEVLDWAYARMLHKSRRHRDEAGRLTLDTSVRLRAFQYGREVFPWNLVSYGATIVLKRLPFERSLEAYTVPRWHATTEMERAQMPDDFLIRSFVAHQEVSMVVEADFMRRSRAEQSNIVQRPRVRRRVKGIVASALRAPCCEAEERGAMTDFQGNLVVCAPREEEFQQVMGLRPIVQPLALPAP